MLVFITILTLLSGFVYANGARMSLNPLTQTITFDTDPGIGLTSETVTFNIGDDYDHAKVEVVYHLTNLTEEDQNFDLLFITPVSPESNFQAQIDGIPVENIVVNKATIGPSNWDSNSADIEKVYDILDPISNKFFHADTEIHDENFHDLVDGTTLPIRIEREKSITLKITYNSQNLLYNSNNVLSTVRKQLYYLTPAKFWEGDTKVKLIVQFPDKGKFKINSNLPLEKVSKTLYEGTFDTLPDSEWYFSYTKRGLMFFNINDKATHNTIIFIILVGLICARFIEKHFYKSKRFKYISIVLMIITFFCFRPTYEFMYMLFFFIAIIIMTPFISIPLLIIIIVIIYKKIRKRIERKKNDEHLF